jgi:asparagine synthase (glutamine-hydrolysing)
LERCFSEVPAGLHFVERMMYLDTTTYLPDDILCKVDRASMAFGLEARVPFLDNNLVALAWSLPLKSRIYKGLGKWPLRQVLKRYVPEQLFDRPKAGFGIPIGDWLREPMRDWAEELLSEGALRRTGYFRPETVRRQWAEHLSGRINNQHALWSVLMFQMWSAKYMT